MRSSRLAAALLLATSTTVNAALQPGDIAFTAFNADEDGFAVVALRPIAAFSTIHFSDNEWTGGAPGIGAFNTGESTFAWVTGPEPIAAGTVIRFSAVDQPPRAASVGAFGILPGGTTGFAATGDTLYAYVGETPTQPTQLLAAISSDGFAGSDLTGSGLAVGVNAIAVGSGADYAEYQGMRVGAASFADYATLIADASQWRSHATGEFAATVPNLEPFAVAAVPEPQTYAMLATGLGLIGWRLRKRAQQHAPWQISIPSARLAFA